MTDCFFYIYILNLLDIQLLWPYGMSKLGVQMSNGSTLCGCSGSCKYCSPAYSGILHFTRLLLIYCIGGKNTLELKGECQRDVPHKYANISSNATP